MNLKKIVYLLHYLSLDVVAGAVICHWAFAKLPDGTGQPNEVVLAVLAAVTWLIYIFDRLLDVRGFSSSTSISKRHQFHATHQYNLQIFGVGLFLLSVVLVFYLPVTVIKLGGILGIFLAIYFWLLHKFFVDKLHFRAVKEPVTAFSYTVAVVGTAFATMPSVNLSGWILAFNFLLIAFQNLLIFSYFESLEIVENQTIVKKIGARVTRRSIRFIAFFVVFSSLLFFVGGNGYANLFAFIQVFMTLSLSFLLINTQFFAKNERYRWLGDAVFLLPALLLFLF